MNKRIDIISADKLNHYIKGTYTGSYKGMRYLIRSETEEEVRRLCLCVWPEPYCFDAAREEAKQYFRFDFTEEGLSELEETLNTVYIDKFQS